jgi:hypothetical protein
MPCSSNNQTICNSSEIQEFNPTGNSSVIRKKTILKPNTRINLPSVINLNNASMSNSSIQNHLIDLTNYSNNDSHQNNKLKRFTTLNTDFYTVAKIGDYRITVKSMNDLKSGNWLNDSVRT